MFNIFLTCLSLKFIIIAFNYILKYIIVQNIKFTYIVVHYNNDLHSCVNVVYIQFWF